jgi:hypothetical protein
MKKTDLMQTLRERYPKIFPQTGGDFGVGDGWFNILDAVCGCIQAHVDWTQNQHDNAIRYNTMAAALVDGDEAPFLAFYEKMPQDWLVDQRGRILAGGQRPVTEPCKQVVAVQVKEKFGTLRFYVNGGDDTTRGMIQMAEAMTAVTCEECGAPGTTGGRGWIRTLCPTHHMKDKE